MSQNKTFDRMMLTKQPRGNTITESKSSLGHLLGEAKILLDNKQLDLLWKFHQLLRRHNEEYDLTRLRTFNDIAVKHYIDCMIVPSLVELSSPLLDIGTGAGFPGIPLKIMLPDCEIILSESRSKRVEFLEFVLKELGLKGIRVYGKGILPGRMNEKVAGVITRALETAEKTLERVDDILDTGGQVILMKGPQCEEEIAEALHSKGESYALEKNISYTLPGTRHHRKLVIFKKISTPKIQKNNGEKSERAFVGISSPANPSFKEWKSLLSGRGIKKTGMALVSGSKIISEIIKLKPGIIHAIIAPDSYKSEPEGLSETVKVYRLPGELFRELDVNGTNYPLLEVKVPELPYFEGSAVQSGAVLLIPFQDPVNVGSVIRSAAAFGIKTIVLLKEAANPFHPKSLRASGTAAFLVDFFEGPSIHDLPDIGIPIIALSADGKDIADFTFPDRFALLPGMEGPGLPENIKADDIISIPMENNIESLNAAAATSIVFYEWRRKRCHKS
jgi:16S rRNA (guanine(527)-N(7))-methyltransferase RsmG